MATVKLICVLGVGQEDKKKIKILNTPASNSNILGLIQFQCSWNQLDTITQPFYLIQEKKPNTEEETEMMVIY